VKFKCTSGRRIYDTLFRAEETELQVENIFIIKEYVIFEKLSKT